MSDTPETDALREAIDNGAATEAEMTSLAGKLERERDELRADQINHEDLSMRYMDERDEAREDAKRANYNATQETLKVVRWLGAWIEACRERDEAREAFVVATSQLVQVQEVVREIAAADWKTSGELRGMAKRVLEGKK
jgi:hypothetical protein